MHLRKKGCILNKELQTVEDIKLIKLIIPDLEILHSQNRKVIQNTKLAILIW